MAIKKPTKLLLFLAFFSVQLLAQDCLEYSEIGGSECVACVPDGWMPTTGTTPDIIPDDGSWPGGGCMIENLSGASPGGGNMSFFASANSSYQEGMTTTVSGLNTGQEYGFGLYWEQVTASGCGVFDAGELIITVDGEVYEFDGAEDWEFIEICFTPSASSIVIEMMINSEGMNVIVVDSPDCDDLTPCCPLNVLLEEEEYEICPGEEFVIEGSIDNSEGDVIIEWTSDPADGIDYLSETDILSPTFSFPEDENFDGETFEFTLTVEDDNCAKELYLSVIVNPSEVPEFEISICEIDFLDILPTESLNGYTGTWSGNFDFEELVGTIQTYTFTLDSGQDNCIEEYIYEFPINAAVDPTFEFNSIYCVLDQEDYELPEESEEDIEGEWIEDDFTPNNLGVGVFTFEFIPYPEYCSFPYLFEIEVFEESLLSFDLPDTFCVSAQNYILPNPSIENIFGSWEDPEIDLSSPRNRSITFTPEDVNDCYQEYVYNYTVIESVDITFNIPESVCRLDNIMVFDSNSLEGVKGYWNPLAVNLDTISESQIDIIWTPINASNSCVQEKKITISIDEPRIIELELPNYLCKNDDILVLPLSDLNDTLLGNWNIDEINPSTIQSSIVDVVFTPLDETCTRIFSTSINILELENPTFSFETEFCSSDDQTELPFVDDSGIEGSWSIPIIDPAAINGEVTSIFTPNDDQNCVNEFEATFTINNLITPQFDLPPVFCLNNSEYIFTELSTNNIEGSWAQVSFDPNNFNGNTFTNTFTPNDLSCNALLEVAIPTINFEEIQFNINNSSSCSASDGSIFLSSANGFEFSIDNGTNWQDDLEFENLNAGNYQILVRSNMFNICIESYEFQISAPSAPSIILLEANGITDCNLSDGTLICEAEGNNLEYSIDNGLTWQTSNTFSDLDVGNYILLVRADGDSNCSTQQSFQILDIPNIAIDSIEISNISDCGRTDGELLVLPNDVIYQYSIDGSSWQTSNVFANLNEGEYEVSMRLTQSPNCIANSAAQITTPENPNIISIEGTNPSDCGVEDGTITIEATGIDLEYSIDNGINWSNTNSFSNLPSGIFVIKIREKNSPNCTDETSETLESPNTPQIVNFEISDISDCITNDGKIEIITATSDVQFSIDNGNSWQELGLFEDLNPEDYIVIIRNVNSLDCTINLPFTISSIPCPCNDLEIEISSTDINCFDPNSGALEIINIDGFFTNEDYQLTWSNGSNNPAIENLTSGWYSYEIEYDRNCTLVDSILLNAFDPINFGLLSFDPNCTEGGSIEVTDIEGGSGEFEVTLNGVNFGNDNVFFNLSAGEYEVFITDNFDCSQSESVALNANYDLSLNIPEVQPINFGEFTTLNPLINQTSIDSFEWSPSFGILNPNNLIAEVSPEETTQYTLTIYFGECVETRTITVEVIENNTIYTGNIFSPNGDGNNDYFYIQSSAESNIEITTFNIYDRWGNLVFNKPNPESNIEAQGWDGTRNGQPLSAGVYTYMIIYNNKEKQEVLSGHLTLVK